MIRKKHFYFLIVFLLGFFLAYKAPVKVEPYEAANIDVSQEPSQISISAVPKRIIKNSDGEYTISLFSQYEISARIVSKKNYYVGWQAKLAPVDFALAWGNLARPDYRDFIKYSQANRWYFFRYNEKCPYDQQYIESHSSNHHIVPANNNVLKAIRLLNVDDKVKLYGYLINIDGKLHNGKTVWWRSSQTRSDTGEGSCEVLYITKVVIGHTVYQ